ncbi:MAG: NifB/NifX family molybdenum-iron cluster-binding protein [Anaerolineales bacterium]
MKIALTTTAPDLNAPLDPRFGRCAYILLIDVDTMEYQSYPNPANNAPGGAGIKMAQFVAELKPDAVISGDFGPNASDALRAANLSLYLYGNSQTVEEVIANFKSGNLKKV